jgi:hypothetical protein
LAVRSLLRQPEGGHEKDSLYLPPGSGKMEVDLTIDWSFIRIESIVLTLVLERAWKIL